jgi:hypothetical protein
MSASAAGFIDPRNANHWTLDFVPVPLAIVEDLGVLPPRLRWEWAPRTLLIQPGTNCSSTAVVHVIYGRAKQV